MTPQDLSPQLEAIRVQLSAKNDARERAVAQSRELIRHCSECIRAIHRREWDNAQARLSQIDHAASAIRAITAPYPELYHTGYTQDALKEVVEAHATYAIIRELPLPSAEQLHVEAATYLLGLGEAATELRRFILDIMRLETSHSASAERLLAWMDAIYEELVTFDFPDAITYGLRRQTDIVRGVLERTRGDMTTSLRQHALQEALSRLETQLGKQT